MIASNPDFERKVVVTRASAVRYGELAEPVEAPELPQGRVTDIAAAAVRSLLAQWGLDAARFGSRDWNPFSDLIRPGERVTLKPNWVLHFNESGGGMDCLVTHASVIEAVARYVALAEPGSIVIGDAPVQGCDFEVLQRDCGFERMRQRLEAGGIPVRVVDFRRTVLSGHEAGAARREGRRELDCFVEVDLGAHSLLEPISGDSEQFRVAMYDPDMMQRNHAPGRHKYLIAREVLDADVVVSLPKLKTHKKSCVTGALKNLIGINGNKEYLPHYRKGRHGDGYAGERLLKDAAESLSDIAYRRRDGLTQSVLGRGGQILTRISGKLTGDYSIEGSWWGNDTIWRTCLDLQRVLRYGRPDGTLADAPQRRTLAITDAIIGGEKDGPLASSPIASGFVTAGANMPALEWVHSLLMGLDPRRIALVRESFAAFDWPLAGFSPSEIEVLVDGRSISLSTVGPLGAGPFEPARGWKGHCELEPEPAVQT